MGLLPELLKALSWAKTFNLLFGLRDAHAGEVTGRQTRLDRGPRAGAG